MTPKQTKSTLTKTVKRIHANQTIKNIAKIATGIASAQAITILFTPLLTRVYTPEAFGILATFTAIIGVITPVATFGYANAIVLPQSTAQALAVARLAATCAAAITPITFLIVYTTESNLLAWTGATGHPYMLYLIPPTIAVASFVAIAEQAAIREHLFGPKATSHFTATLLTNITKLTLGLLSPSGASLIASTFFGRVISAATLLAFTPRKGALQPKEWLFGPGKREAAHEYRDFAIYRMPQSVINAASFSLPVLLLSKHYGTDSAGQYSLVTLLLSAPVMLLGQAVSEAFFPKVTESIRDNPKDCHNEIVRATKILVPVSFIPFALIALTAPTILPIALGESWQKCGDYAQWVAIWMSTVLMTRPAIAAIPALRLQRTLLIYEAIITILRIGAITLMAPNTNDLTTVATFSILNAAGYLVLLRQILNRSKELSRHSPTA